MPRSLLIISREDGRALKTYGLKKVQTNMKFSFIISLVTGIFLCGSAAADTRILHDLKYLEYLNDLDRRNVELDDIHKQWPFHSIARTIDDEDEEAMPEQKAIDREKLLQVVSMARADLANKHNQNYRDRFLDKLEDGFKHAKDASERANQLSQYRRYKPLEQEILEEARMYPERVEDEVRFDDDDDAYQNSDITFDEEDEEIPALRPSLPRPFFPRIAAMEKPIINYDNTFQDDSEEDAEEPEEEEEVLKPSFPKAYFPRIAPVDIPVNYKIDHLNFDDQKTDSDNNHVHNEHEDYKFKDGEEFPHTIEFGHVPVAEDPSEFGVGPNDPRFYRDAEQKEETVTGAPKQQDTIHPYLVKSPYVSKTKMNSRSDLQKQGIATDEVQLESFANKDVEVVPFKPDNQSDSAGVYIIAIVAGISAAATVGLIAVGIGWYKCKNRGQRNTVDGCISE